MSAEINKTRIDDLMKYLEDAYMHQWYFDNAKTNDKRTEYVELTQENARILFERIFVSSD